MADRQTMLDRAASLAVLQGLLADEAAVEQASADRVQAASAERLSQEEEAAAAMQEDLRALLCGNSFELDRFRLCHTMLAQQAARTAHAATAHRMACDDLAARSAAAARARAARDLAQREVTRQQRRLAARQAERHESQVLAAFNNRQELFR